MEKARQIGDLTISELRVFLHKMCEATPESLGVDKVDFIAAFAEACATIIEHIIVSGANGDVERAKAGVECLREDLEHNVLARMEKEREEGKKEVDEGRAKTPWRGH